MRKHTFLIILILIPLIGFSQIDVADLTFKLDGKTEKLLYYAFPKGDEVVFSIEEVEGKEITEIGFGLYKASPVYENYKVSKVTDKKLKIDETQVYQFRFYNGDARGKLCKVTIKRNAQEYTKNFSTQVKWREVADTIFDVKKENVTSGFRTVQKQKSRKVLASVDTSFVAIIDRLERVHSVTNANGNITILNFQIPDRIAEPSVFNPMRETTVVSWAYTIAALGDVKQWYDQANSKAGQSLAKGVANYVGVSAANLALFNVALTGISLFANPPKGNNVKHEMSYAVQGAWYPVKVGNSVTSVAQVSDVKPGHYAIKLTNDNIMDGINVDIKVMAISVTKNYELEYYTVEDQEPIRETRIIKTPKKINVTRVPVFEVIRP